VYSCFAASFRCVADIDEVCPEGAGGTMFFNDSERQRAGSARLRERFHEILRRQVFPLNREGLGKAVCAGQQRDNGSNESHGNHFIPQFTIFSPVAPQYTSTLPQFGSSRFTCMSTEWKGGSRLFTGTGPNVANCVGDPKW